MLFGIAEKPRSADLDDFFVRACAAAGEGGESGEIGVATLDIESLSVSDPLLTSLVDVSSSSPPAFVL